MAARLLFILFCFFCIESEGQITATEKKIIDKISTAANDSNKIMALNELAEYYYAYKLDKKADSVQQKQLMLAQLSNNKNLVLSALFTNSFTFTSWVSNESFERLMQFVQKGENYARELGRDDYVAFANLRKAALLRKKGQLDEAMGQAALAFSSIEDMKADSLKASIYIELGDIFLAKGEIVSAYKNYNNAFDLAYILKNIPLQSQVYHHLANLYNSLENKEMAEKILLKSLALNKENNNKRGLLLDYVDLARFIEKVEYIHAAIALADELQWVHYKLFNKRLLLAYYTVIEKSSEKSLSYLQENEDVRQSYLNQGLPYYYYNIGFIYKVSNKPDSAIHYFNLANPGLKTSFGVSIQRSVLKQMGECYILLKQDKKAIEAFEEALELGQGTNDMKTDSLLTNNLGRLFAQSNDFKKAYSYNLQYLNVRSALDKLANQRDLVLLEVDRENQKHERDMEELAMQTLRTRNLQYMGISVAIAIVFLSMILMGMFPISRFTIRLLSFFAFICLFEFIVLLIETYLHRIAHGEPLKVWMGKIALIAMLVPFQHYLEHGLVKFLESKKLLKLRQQFSFRKFWTNIKKPAPVEPGADFEQDTAVL